MAIAGKFLIGVGTHTDIVGDKRTLSAGQIGGTYAHVLTEDEMPIHHHSLRFNKVGSGYGSGIPWNGSNIEVGWDGTGCANSGGGQKHNNVPPYLAVYMWQRTA